ncbi:MAG TPA: hypothetical protein V6D20_17630 [Candidatus Obscuribacterales bacterium]
MQPQKPHKIDLSAEYPCPCRRHGQLKPITLTEAFGCDRCQQIFVVQENGYALEQLSSHYPYKKVWRWTGRQWSMVHPSLARGYLPVLMLVILLGLAFLLLITILQSILSSDVAFRIIAALVIVMLVLMLWMAYRQ